MKIAILTDSNCGINKEEANKLGIYVLPMPFYIVIHKKYDYLLCLANIWQLQFLHFNLFVNINTLMFNL